MTRAEVVSARIAVVVAAAVLACLAFGGAAGPAEAHPYGPPPQAMLGVTGDEIVLEWDVAPDDAFAIGEHVGLIAEGTGRRKIAGILTPQEQDRIADTLAGDEEVREYLRGGVTVRQDGERCPLTSLDARDLVRDGATYRFSCARPPQQFELEVGLLHDVHESYRTFVTAAEEAVPQRAVFTVDDPAQHWRMDGTNSGQPALAMGGLAGVAALALGGLAIGLRLMRTAVRPAGRLEGEDTIEGGRDGPRR